MNNNENKEKLENTESIKDETKKDNTEKENKKKENSNTDNTKEKKQKKSDPDKELKKKEKKARKSLRARAFKRGWFSAVLVVLFIAAVIIVNVIVSVLVDKVPALNIDMTGEDNFSLTDETLDFLADLDQDMTIYVLSTEDEYKNGGDYFIQANTLFHAYENASDRITLEYVDLASDPTFSSQYADEEIATYNMIVQGENEYEYLLESDMYEFDSYYASMGSYVVTGSKVEESLTSAILNLTLEDKPKVTFISDITGEDYSSFKSLLDTNGFETEEISPAVGTISDDTSVVVLFAPTVDLDAKFVDQISDFLYNGGNYGRQLLYLPSYRFVDTPNIDSLIEEWGMEVEEGYAIENDTNYMANLYNQYILFSAQYSDSTYTANMKNSSLPFCFVYGYTRSINITDSQMASSLMTLTEKSQVAYIEEIETSDEASPQANYADVPNAVVAAISTKSNASSNTDTDTDSTETSETKSSNIIVIASSISLDSSSLSMSTYGNSSYMLSLLNTVTGRGDVGISIESKTLEGTELGITTAQIYVLGAILVLVIPLAILIAGIVIFIKRRNM